MSSSDTIGPMISLLIVGVFFLFFILVFVIDYIAHWDISPAKGSAVGYIYYQEKSGIYQLDFICWKDTPYSPDCEIFDPGGKTYDPGKYKIDYECTTFVWAWEHPNECKITNATRLGDIT